MTDMPDRPPATVPSRRPVALLAAWVLLGVLFAWAIAANAWTGYSPSLVVFSLAAAALCLLDERASIVLFIGCTALNAYGYIMHLPFSPSMARIVAVAVVGGAVLRWLRAKPRPKITVKALTPWDIGILVFYAGAALSVFDSYSLWLSGVGILHVTLLTGVYFVLSRAARTATGRSDITLAAVVFGSLNALVAIAQSFAPELAPPVLQATTSLAEGVAVVRASGFFDNPNTMALLLVLVAVFAAERAWMSQRASHRRLFAAASALCLVGIGVSYSRAALVGIVVGAVVLGVLLIRRARQRVMFLLALAVLFALLLAIPGVGERALSIVDFTSDGSAMDRVYLSQVSVDMFADHPITGVGIQAFRAAYPDYADERVTIDPVTDGHQMPFSVPAETGVLGLVAEAAFTVMLLLALVRAMRGAERPVVAGGLAAMSAVSAMTFFNTFIFFESLWIAAALVGTDFLLAHPDAPDAR